MSKITIRQSGNMKDFNSFFKSMSPDIHRNYLEYYAKKGVDILSSATPVDSGETAKSWYYKIDTKSDGSFAIYFCNSNMAGETPVAIIVNNGHATTDGAWVEGANFIEPSIRPLFNEIVDEIWKGVKTK